VSPRRSVTYTIPGPPRPKGSRVAGVTKTGVRFNRESNPRATEWLKAAKAQLRDLHDAGPLLPPYQVVITLYFPEPKSKPTWPRSGDVDKYSRNVLDALTQSSVIEDDRHVIELSAIKRYGSPRTEITVHEAGT
jgi:Holliday junction resolvase RusA-like endonuclease